MLWSTTPSLDVVVERVEARRSEDALCYETISLVLV